MQNRTSLGFTLIELSIVLVIIGLIVGGVLVGQSLIKAAEMRAVLSEVEGFATAINTFRNKYNCLPGDCSTASTFNLGSNGTGDKNIAPGFAGGGSTTDLERYYLWQHLGAAGLISGTYTGAAGGAGTRDHIPGTNCPRSRLSGGGYSFYNLGAYVGDPHWFPGVYTNAILLGTRRTNEVTVGPLISPIDTMSLDMKIDDGKPGLGKIITARPSAGVYWDGCSTTTDPSTSAYDLSNTGKTCTLKFIKPF